MQKGAFRSMGRRWAIIVSWLLSSNGTISTELRVSRQNGNYLPAALSQFLLPVFFAICSFDSPQLFTGTKLLTSQPVAIKFVRLP